MIKKRHYLDSHRKGGTFKCLGRRGDEYSLWLQRPKPLQFLTGFFTDYRTYLHIEVHSQCRPLSGEQIDLLTARLVATCLIDKLVYRQADPFVDRIERRPGDSGDKHVIYSLCNGVMTLNEHQVRLIKRAMMATRLQTMIKVAS